VVLIKELIIDIVKLI